MQSTNRLSSLILFFAICLCTSVPGKLVHGQLFRRALCGQQRLTNHGFQNPCRFRAGFGRFSNNLTTCPPVHMTYWQSNCFQYPMSFQNACVPSLSIPVIPNTSYLTDCGDCDAEYDKPNAAWKITRDCKDTSCICQLPPLHTVVPHPFPCESANDDLSETKFFLEIGSSDASGTDPKGKAMYSTEGFEYVDNELKFDTIFPDGWSADIVYRHDEFPKTITPIGNAIANPVGFAKLTVIGSHNGLILGRHEVVVPINQSGQKVNVKFGKWCVNIGHNVSGDRGLCERGPIIPPGKSD